MLTDMEQSFNPQRQKLLSFALIQYLIYLSHFFSTPILAPCECVCFSRLLFIRIKGFVPLSDPKRPFSQLILCKQLRDTTSQWSAKLTKNNANKSTVCRRSSQDEVHHDSKKSFQMMTGCKMRKNQSELECQLHALRALESVWCHIICCVCLIQSSLNSLVHFRMLVRYTQLPWSWNMHASEFQSKLSNFPKSNYTSLIVRFIDRQMRAMVDEWNCHSLETSKRHEVSHQVNSAEEKDLLQQQKI